MCVDANYGIGKDNKMPWNNKEELRHFRKITNSRVVIMGRKTFESIKAPLVNRTNVVLSKSLNKNCVNGTVEIINSVEDCIKKYKEADIIGGSSIYEQFIDYVDEIHLSRLKESYDVDRYFPKIKGFKKIREEKFDSFTYEVYVRCID